MVENYQIITFQNGDRLQMSKCSQIYTGRVGLWVKLIRLICVCTSLKYSSSFFVMRSAYKCSRNRIIRKNI